MAGVTRYAVGVRPVGPRYTYEPTPWRYDGGSCRISVMDPIRPTRIVRQVGWVKCLCCARHHFSEDVLRIRLCAQCGGLGGQPLSGYRTAGRDDDDPDPAI